jgi:hypothetical protein
LGLEGLDLGIDQGHGDVSSMKGGKKRAEMTK